MVDLTTFTQRWRERADFLESIEAPAAAVIRKILDELEVEVARYDLELLTVAQAAAESGFSEDTIRRHIDTGKLAAIREDGRLLIHRGNLPRKAGSTPAPSRDPKVAAESERLRRLTP